MDKKGTIITSLSFKSYIFLILIIVIIIWGFLKFYPDIKDFGVNCEDYIPNRLDIECSPDYRGKMQCNKQVMVWKDGTEIKDAFFTCKEAEKEGENINYLYCKSLSRYTYYKTPINEDGTLGKMIKLYITLVIDPEDHTNEGYKIVSHECERR